MSIMIYSLSVIVSHQSSKEGHYVVQSLCSHYPALHGKLLPLPVYLCFPTISNIHYEKVKFHLTAAKYYSKVNKATRKRDECWACYERSV